MCPVCSSVLRIALPFAPHFFSPGLHCAQCILPHLSQTRILDPLFLAAWQVAHVMFALCCAMVFLLKMHSSTWSSCVSICICSVCASYSLLDMLHSTSEVFRALSRCQSAVVVGSKICVISKAVLLLASGCARMLSWVHSYSVFLFRMEAVVQCAHAFLLRLQSVYGFSAVVTGCGVVAHASCVPRKCRSKSSPVIIVSSDGLRSLMLLSTVSIVSSSEVVKPSLTSLGSPLLPSSVFRLSILLRFCFLCILSCGFSCVLLPVLVACSVALATDTAS